MNRYVFHSMDAALLAVVLILAAACAAPENNAANPAGDLDTQTSQREIPDGWITAKVKSAIFNSSVNNSLRVHVKTLHGVVTLKGTLPDQETINRFKLLAERIRGVKSVDLSDLVVAVN